MNIYKEALRRQHVLQSKELNLQDKLFLIFISSYFFFITFFFLALNENILYFYQSYINNVHRHSIMLFKMYLFVYQCCCYRLRLYCTSLFTRQFWHVNKCRSKNGRFSQFKLRHLASRLNSFLSKINGDNLGLIVEKVKQVHLLNISRSFQQLSAVTLIINLSILSCCPERKLTRPLSVSTNPASHSCLIKKICKGEKNNNKAVAFGLSWTRIKH